MSIDRKHKIKIYKKDSNGVITTEIREYPAPSYRTAVARAKTFIGLGGIFKIEGVESDFAAKLNRLKSQTVRNIIS